MKKSLTLFVAFALSISVLSAQPIKNYNFENGETKGWLQPKQSDFIKVVSVNRGEKNKKAMQVSGNAFISFTSPAPQTSYKLSLDFKAIGGETLSRLVINAINPETKKFEQIKVITLPKNENFAKKSIEFQSKYKGYTRVSVIPGKGGKVLVDNFKLIKAQ